MVWVYIYDSEKIQHEENESTKKSKCKTAWLQQKTNYQTDYNKNITIGKEFTKNLFATTGGTKVLHTFIFTIMKIFLYVIKKLTFGPLTISAV